MKKDKSFRLAIFASGSGSNAENLIKYFQENQAAKVVLVLCNKKEAGVLERADRLGVPSQVLSKTEFNDPGTLLGILEENQVDNIILAGFLLLIPAFLIEHFPDRIINIHPALLPKYGGKGMYGSNVHKAVLEAGEEKSGITIHFVNQEYDKGEIIAQFETPIEKHWNPEDLQQKIHELEHKHFPEVVERVLKNSGINE